MLRALIPLFILAILLTAVQPQATAQTQGGFTQQDRDLLVSLSVRMDEMDKRMVELREDMNKRFEQMTTFLWMIVGIFTAIAVANIGLVLWDRRSMVRPFEIKMTAVEKDIAANADQIKRLMSSLRELAREDPKVAQVLRQFHLL